MMMANTASTPNCGVIPDFAVGVGEATAATDAGVFVADSPDDVGLADVAEGLMEVVVTGRTGVSVGAGVGGLGVTVVGRGTGVRVGVGVLTAMVRTWTGNLCWSTARALLSSGSSLKSQLGGLTARIARRT